MRTGIFAFCGAIIFACNGKNPEQPVKIEKFPVETKNSDSIIEEKTKFGSDTPEKSDEVLIYEGKEFRQFEPALVEISEAEYKLLLKSASRKKCNKPEDFFKSCGLKIKHECGDICDTYLVESTGKKMLLPSGYDQGIIDLDISVSCTKFLIFSSYDGPDYVDYYSDRSEINSYRLTGKNGLNDIRPDFTIYFKDWSISNAAWIDDKSLALKLYSEGLNEAVYHYFRAAIK